MISSLCSDKPGYHHIIVHFLCAPSILSAVRLGHISHRWMIHNKTRAPPKHGEMFSNVECRGKLVGVGIFCVESRFHPTSMKWDLGLMQKCQSPNYLYLAGLVIIFNMFRPHKANGLDWHKVEFPMFIPDCPLPKWPIVQMLMIDHTDNSNHPNNES